jgi:glycerol-3-phosphate dehydrogenase
VPRSHRIDISEPDEQRHFRIYNMIGGKLTTFRSFAELTADRILAQLDMTRAVSTEKLSYRGAEEFPVSESDRQSWIRRIAVANNLDEERVANLLERYGTDAERFARERSTPWRTAVRSLPDYTVGEIEYLAERECIRHLSDLVRRRSVITMLGQASEEALTELAEIVGAVLEWDEQRRNEEIELALREATDRK